MKVDFSLKKLDRPSCFSGINVRPKSNGSLLSTRSKYIRDILSRAKIANVSGVPKPMLSTCKPSKHGSEPFYNP